MQAVKESERVMLVMMVGDAVLVTVLRCCYCCSVFGGTLRDSGSAVGGHVLE
jgi:hypothetical protein